MNDVKRDDTQSNGFLRSILISAAQEADVHTLYICILSASAS